MKINWTQLGASVVVSLFIGLLCYHKGLEDGNKQYNQELLQELGAKGGAPVLVYPPDAMFEFPED